MKKLLLLVLLIVSWTNAQTVIQSVFTDYKGYFKSTIQEPSSEKVTNSHNLIGFEWRDSYFSTGVADSVLIARNPEKIIIKQPFKSFDTDSLAKVRKAQPSDNLVGVPIEYQGYLKSNYRVYLSDGEKGMDLSTAIFNMKLTVPRMVFNNVTVTPSSIGDGIPDIIVTQTGQPSPNQDIFYFESKQGQKVGKDYSVIFNQIPKLLDTTFKFYSLDYTNEDGNLQPSTIVDGDRSLRMLAFDWADLGITKDNYEDIYSFSQQFSGDSDIAFIAYNQYSLQFLYNINGKVEIENDNRIPFAGIELNLHMVNEHGEMEETPVHTTITDSNGEYTFKNIIANLPDTKYKIVVKYDKYNPKYYIIDNRDRNLNDFLDVFIGLGHSNNNDFVLGNFCILEPSKVIGGKETTIGISTLSKQLTNWPNSIKNGFIALESNKQGLVITRTTSNEVSSDSLVEGMIIYDTTDNCIKLYDGNEWNCISRDCNEKIFNPDVPTFP